MSIIGKLHEISFYSFVVSIFCLIKKIFTFQMLWNAKFHFASFYGFFLTFLFWGTVLYIPIAIIGALYTKIIDNGEGLSFTSDHVFVIIFAHIAEEILGIIMTPIWFIIAIIKKDLEAAKIIDYFLWFIEVLYLTINLVHLMHNAL